jgi:hypothetical protein
MKEIKNKKELTHLLYDEQGAVGYLLAWLLGVPAFVLVIIFVLRGFT